MQRNDTGNAEDKVIVTCICDTAKKEALRNIVNLSNPHVGKYLLLILSFSRKTEYKAVVRKKEPVPQPISKQ